MGELVAVVFDIDGVLFLDKRPVAGSRRVLNWLRQEGVQFSLLTNDSNQSVNEKSLTLKGVGLNVFPEEIISSGEGLVELVLDHHLWGNTFFAMGDLGTPCFGESAGLVITRNVEELPASMGSSLFLTLIHLPQESRVDLTFFFEKVAGETVL